MIVFALFFLLAVVVLALLPGVLAGPLSWCLVLYVLWRAAPGIRADLRGLVGRRSALAPRLRQGAWR